MSRDHGHGHGLRSSDAASRALAVSLLLHTLMMVLEAVAGWLSGSLALVSDAGHMMSDVGSLALAYAAQRMRAHQPRGYTFGLRRLPVLGGLANALSLLVVVVLIVLESIERLDDPPQVMGLPALVVGVLGLLVNIGGIWLIHRADSRSVNMRSALLHVVADGLGSVAAVVSAALVLGLGWMRADPIASLIIAVLIAGATIPLVVEAGRILLQRVPVDVDIDAVRQALLADPSVAEILDLHLWELDSEERVLSAIVRCTEPTLAAATECADRLRRTLHDRFGVEHATVETRLHEAPEPPYEF